MAGGMRAQGGKGERGEFVAIHKLISQTKSTTPLAALTSPTLVLTVWTEVELNGWGGESVRWEL